MNWEQKYIKYKKKYFELLKIGGQPGRCKKKMNWHSLVDELNDELNDEEIVHGNELYTIHTLNINFEGVLETINPNFKIYDNTKTYLFWYKLLKFLNIPDNYIFNFSFYKDSDPGQIISHRNYYDKEIFHDFKIIDSDTIILINSREYSGNHSRNKYIDKPKKKKRANY